MIRKYSLGPIECKYLEKHWWYLTRCDLYLKIFYIAKNRPEIKLKKLFKKGLDTVLTNYEHSVSALKYKHNIFTNLHRTRDFSSDNEQFEKSLDELRIIYSRNNYPSWLIEQKIKIFLENDKKPPREENFTLFVLIIIFTVLIFMLNN